VRRKRRSRVLRSGQDQPGFFEHVQVTRDLPQDYIEYGFLFLPVVYRQSGERDKLHWAYGIDLPYLFREDRAILRVEVGRVETVCLAITIEGLLARVIHQHSIFIGGDERKWILPRSLSIQTTVSSELPLCIIVAPCRKVPHGLLDSLQVQPRQRWLSVRSRQPLARYGRRLELSR